MQVLYLNISKIFADFFPASAEVNQKALRPGSLFSPPANISWHDREGFNHEARKIQSIFSSNTNRASLV